MADVSTIASLATAGGTLVLAVATFSAVMVPRVDTPHPGLDEALRDGEMLTVDLFYGDHEGGQGTISRFILTPGEEDGQWHCSVVCHWGSRASTRASATSTEVAETWTAGTHVDQGDRRSMPNSV